MLDKNQIYIVVDIETDGPLPGTHSMRSLAAVASTADEEVTSFYRKLLPFDGAKQDTDTMEWWAGQPEAWQEVITDAQPPEKVIQEFSRWVESLGGVPVFVAHPVILDYGFMNWYLRTFASNPFDDYSGVMRVLDLPSFAAGKLLLPLSQSGRLQLPDELKAGMPAHSHKAIDDARGYGVLLRNLLRFMSQASS